jgi:hypothetical protein
VTIGFSANCRVRWRTAAQRSLFDSELRRDIQRIAEEEQRTITQVCELLLVEGVEAYKKDGPKFIQRLVAKQKLRTK